MIQAARCKFCRKPLVLHVDDAYAEHGDIFKLMKLAACDHCADLRLNRRLLESRLQRICALLCNCRANQREEKSATVRDVLTRLTQDYAKLVAAWHNMSGMAWDEEMVNLLIEKPDKWAAIISHYWRTFRQFHQPANDNQ